MRLLLFTRQFPPVVGGIGRYCEQLALGLSHKGVEVYVLTPERFAVARCVDSASRPYEVIYMPAPSLSKWDVLSEAIWFARWHRRLRPQWVIVASSAAQLSLGMLTRFLPLRSITIAVGSDILYAGERWQRRLLFDRLCHSSKSIVAISRYVRRLLVERFRLPMTKINVIYFGLQEERWLEGPVSEEVAIRQHLGLRGGKVLLTLARLTPRKGQDIVIRALPAILKAVPEAHYVVAGEGPNLSYLQKLAESLEVNHHVTFVGFVPEEEVIPLYDMCDVFVMPSREQTGKVEGLGISFLEAAARGKPMIGGNHGGVPEVILDGETGFLVDPEDPSDVADKVIRLLVNPTMATVMGSLGKQRIAQQFTDQHMIMDFLGLLSNVQHGS